MRDITSREEFKELVRDEVLVLITDNGNKSKVHKGSCVHVSFANFEQKVLKNPRPNGKYAIVSREEARSYQRAKCC